jgi:general secretion pathway protein K
MTARHRRKKRNERGVAMLMVMVAVVLLSTLVYEFMDTSEISRNLAYAARDEVRAHYLARSAVQISRLILHIQKTYVDPYKRQGINIQLWKLPFIDSGTLEGLMGGTSTLDALGIGSGETAQSMNRASQPRARSSAGKMTSAQPGFLALGGTFNAEIESENGKINLNACCAPAQIVVLRRQLEGLFLPSQYNPFFEERKSDGQYCSREEQISSIIDWVDPDTQKSGLEGGFEDDRYLRLRDPYKSKNSKFDTLQELHLVKGVDDDFMAAFGSKLTIYGGQFVVNVASADAEVIKALVRAYVAPNDPLRDPLSRNLDLLVNKFVLYRMGLSETGGSMMFANPITDANAFTGWMMSQGVVLDRSLIGPAIGVDDRVFSIKATAKVGHIWKRLNVVIDNAAPGGRVLYWRED